MSDLRLRVNGREYAGWKSIRIARGIEAACGSFSLSASDRWKERSESWPITEEDECAIVLEGEQVLLGYVDLRSVSYSAREHSLSVEGRDKTGALVDCSASLGQWEFANASALELAKKLAAPFGVSVSMQPGLAPPPPVGRISIDPGESAFEVLARACRMAGLLPVADGTGGLVLSRAGSAKTETDLVEGLNILSASSECGGVNRFRSYRVLGQHRGSDDLYGERAAGISGAAEDAGVRRSSRSLILRADGNATLAQAKARAQWEATVRAAQAQTASVTVQGWTQRDGSPWPVNAIVHLQSPFLEIDSDMLIAEAVYSLDDGGTTTQLSLKRPDAFLPEPVVKQTASGGYAPWDEIKSGAASANFTTASGEAARR